MVSDSDSDRIEPAQTEYLYDQHFEQLRQNCLNEKKLFEDAEFLPQVCT